MISGIRPGVPPVQPAVDKRRPSFSGGDSQRYDFTSPSIADSALRIPASVLRVYFAQNPKKPSAITDPNIRKAVDWFHQHVEAIPALARESRKNHRVHLRQVGEILGLLPAVNSSREAYQQYTGTFNAVEKKVAPAKKDFRMYCHDKIPKPTGNTYMIRHYGFYILVFAPNGAVESFRRNTPLAVEIDEKNQTDFPLRIKLFGETENDSQRLLELTQQKGEAVCGLPDFLLDAPLYTRSVFKTGADGKDAWGSPYTLPVEKRDRLEQFEKSLTSDEEP